MLLPDHLHAVWKLPDGDSDFSSRWARIKLAFTKQWIASGGATGTITESQNQRADGGVWQRRFWEHQIRDEADWIAHMDYIHYNPVKHELVRCPHAWEWSSFSRHVEMDHYELTWQCACNDRRPIPPEFEGLDQAAMEWIE